MRINKCTVAGLMAALCAASAWGATLAYEGFDYAAGTGLNGQLGGSGWSGAWAAPAAVKMAAPANNLTYDGLPSNGNALFNTTDFNKQNTERVWNATGLTDDGDELWFSVVVNVSAGANPSDRDEFRFQLFQGADTSMRNNGTDTLFSIDEMGTLKLWGMSGNAVNASTTISTGQNHLIIGQYIFSDTAGADVWNLWIDPNLSNPLGAPTLTATGDIQLDGEENGLASEILDLRFLRNKGYVDEIRIGTDYGSVIEVRDSEIPTPGALGLMTS